MLVQASRRQQIRKSPASPAEAATIASGQPPPQRAGAGGLGSRLLPRSTQNRSLAILAISCTTWVHLNSKANIIDLEHCFGRAKRQRVLGTAYLRALPLRLLDECA